MTPNFTLFEMTISGTAERLGLDNTPSPEVLPRLVQTAQMLERVRAALGKPVIVTSGYRAPAVNKAVGGVSSSDHAQGQAADIVAPGFGTPHAVAKFLAPQIDKLGIGQILLEGTKGKNWLHLSTRIPDKAVNRVLTITDADTQMGIQQT